MASLLIKDSDGEKVKLDDFYKSLMFQKIMDSDFTRNERDTLLVVFRKTIHYDKWEDFISMYWLGQSVGIGDTTLRITIKRLNEKGLINFKPSTGGKTKSSKKYNSFGISSYLINDVYQKWIKIKDDCGIPLNYE